MQNLKGKTALVTGATRGMGKGIAIGLGEAGATVYITGRKMEPSTSDDQLGGSLLETQSAIEQAGGIAIPVQVDHAHDDQIRSLFERIEKEQNGELDILVNNVFAGVPAIERSYTKPFWENEPELWDELNHVGLRSHYVASVWAARMMVPRKQGLICTVSSWAGLAYLHGVAYGVGKAACDRLASDMALELKPHNVTSITLWPEISSTESITEFLNQTANKEGAEKSAWLSNEKFKKIVENLYLASPVLSGRVIAALANDPSLMNNTGRVHVVSELAQKYGLSDPNGGSPISSRSLRYLLPYFWPDIEKYIDLIPDWKIPWPLLLLGVLESPKVNGYDLDRLLNTSKEYFNIRS